VNLPKLPRFSLPPAPPLPRLVPAIGVVIVALVAAWAAWQPQRSENQSQKALSLLAKGKLPEAGKAADRARSINPTSVHPLFVQGSIAVAAGRKEEARSHFQRALLEQPSNPETWTRLAEFELYRMNNPRDALQIIEGALFLDPRSAPAQTVFFDARRAARGER
jgi:tetratricopeptide (TPR) repeat protein